MRGVGSVVPGACMCVYVGAGEGLFKALNKAHVIEGMVRRGTMVRVGAGRSCPIIGVGVGNLTEAGYQRANQREGWGSLSAGRRRGLGNERQAWGMKTEGTVLLLRDGGVGEKSCGGPLQLRSGLGQGALEKGRRGREAAWLGNQGEKKEVGVMVAGMSCPSVSPGPWGAMAVCMSPPWASWWTGRHLVGFSQTAHSWGHPCPTACPEAGAGPH